MTRTPSRALAAASVAVFLLAACGGDDDAGSAGDDLRPPVAIQVVGAGGDGGNRMSAELAGDAAMDPAGTSMLAWWGFVYEVGDGLPALPADSTAYQFPPGADIDADTVASLATALGVEGSPERGGGTATDGVLWRVGPDDGTAPSITVVANAELSWYYSGAWQTHELAAPEAAPDEAAQEPGSAPAPADSDDVDATDPTGSSDASDAPDTGGAATPGGGVSGSSGDADRDAIDPFDDASTPTPPEGVPSGDEAIAEARRILAELGHDADAFEADAYADEWFASVTMWPSLGTVRSPVAWGFGFGGGGALEWAHGSLATPVATGPYPLVDLDTALERLTDQNGWGGLIGMPEPLLVDPPAESPGADVPVAPAIDPDTAVSDAGASDSEAAPGEAGTGATDATDAPESGVLDEDLVIDTLPVEPIEPGEPEVAVLVDVRADLWWAWDDDGSVWLLPAYTFTDTEGRVHTVPAVTDEFLIVPEPVPMPEPEPMPEPGEPLPTETVPTETAPTDPVDGRDPVEIDLALDELVGLDLAEAENVVAAAGGEVRVIRRDGEDLPATMDFVPSRVNVAVEGDTVTEVLSIG